jgi:hypothetical protein
MEPTAQSNLRDGGSGSCGSAKQARRELLRRRVSPTPRLAGRAVAPPRPVEDPEQQDRAEDETGFRERVAELAFGDDADELGGLMLDNSFARNSDASACGKVTVLLRLLALWASEDLSNKVRGQGWGPKPCLTGMHPKGSDAHSRSAESVTGCVDVRKTGRVPAQPWCLHFPGGWRRAVRDVGRQ